LPAQSDLKLPKVEHWRWEFKIGEKLARCVGPAAFTLDPLAEVVVQLFKLDMLITYAC
jgi:hypothetical protein